jgi:eukaryotic-like serine/threonine-protein kinase
VAGKMPATGGAPVPIASFTERSRGATWGADDTIVYATTAGLYRVSAEGGEPRLLVRPNRERGESDYRWPSFLPGERSVLFTIVPESAEALPRLALLDVDTLEITDVIERATSGRYVSTGHIVYASGTQLRTVAFDLDARRTYGDPVAIPDVEVATTADNGAADFAISDSGTLVFASPPLSSATPLFTPVWIDRRGTEEAVAVEPRGIIYPRVSPDGTRAAFDQNSNGSRDIWILDFARLTFVQLTDGPTEDLLPVWAPDGRRVFFASDRNGDFDIFSQSADGASGPRLEFASPGFQVPQGFVPNGSALIVYEEFKDTRVLDLSHPEQLQPLLDSPEFDQRLADVSPDGRWVAYESDESGDRFEIFVRPFPNVGDRREQISLAGGRYPHWGLKGSDELYYVTLDGAMMAASVKTSPDLKLGPVIKLFDTRPPQSGRSGIPYDVSPVDGRFLVTKVLGPRPSGDQGDVSVVLNLRDQLRALAPTR